MKDVERVLGKLEEFKDHTMDRLDRIEYKIEHLQGFRWKLIGGMMVMSFLVSGLFQIVAAKL